MNRGGISSELILVKLIYIIILLVRPYAYERSACAVRKHNESHAHALISA